MLFANLIKFFTFKPVGFSEIENFIRNNPSSLCYSFSVLKNKLSLFTFEFQERFNSSKNIFKFSAKYVPSIAYLMISYSFAYIYLAFKVIFEPINQCQACIYDTKSACIVIFNSIFTWRKMLYTNTAFTVQYACQIIERFIRPHMVPLKSIIVKAYHNYSFCHSERLSPEAL